MTSPTVNAPAREHKYNAKPAMSSGVPTRPLGFIRPTVSQSVLSTSPPPPTPVDNIHVGNGPGAIALTMMWREAKRPARTLVSECTAAFDGPYE